MAGLVQQLIVEADTHEQLVLAIQIALKWNNKVTHYVTGTDVDGVPFLSFLWAAHSKEAVNLISPIDDAELLAKQIESWLEFITYPEEPQHDGDNNKGFELINTGPMLNKQFYCSWNSYTVITVQPKWIEYAK